MITSWSRFEISTGQVANAYWVEDSTLIEGESKTISRGPYPNHGTGPYFKAVRKGTGFSVDGKPVELGLRYQTAYEGKWNMWYRDGKDGVLTSSNLSKWDNYYCSYGLTEFARRDGNRVYWRFRQWTYGSYSDFPTTKAEWLARRSEICNLVRSRGWLAQDSSYTSDVRNGDINPVEPPPPILKNDELNAFLLMADLQVYPAPFASYFSTAYVASIDALELTDVNTLANIGQIIDYVHAFAEARKQPIKALKKLLNSYKRRGFVKDLWLKYRYEYLTTKSDINAYSELIRRLKALTELAGRKIHSTGWFNSPIGSFKAEVVLYADELLPESTKDWLDSLGVEPNAVNLWDLVPYSFVIDWFFHISDILDYVEKIGNTFEYTIEECWFTYMNSYDNQHIFMRVPGRRLDIPPVYMTKEASSKTIRMRVADSLALFWR